MRHAMIVKLKSTKRLPNSEMAEKVLDNWLEIRSLRCRYLNCLKCVLLLEHGPLLESFRLGVTLLIYLRALSTCSLTRSKRSEKQHEHQWIVDDSQGSHLLVKFFGLDSCPWST